MAVSSSGGVDVAVIVRPSPLARVHLAGRRASDDALVACPRRRDAKQLLRRKRDSAEVDHGILECDLNALALAGRLALVERSQHPDRTVETRASVGDVRPRLERPATLLAGDRDGASRGLGNGIERQIPTERPV